MALCLALGVSARAAGAGELGIEPGMRVRVRMVEPSRTVEGTVLAASPESLRLGRGAFTPRWIPLASISKLEKRTGTRSNAGTGAWIGLGAGVVLGAAYLSLGAAASDEGYKPGYTIAGAVVGGLAGLGIGYFAGSIFRSSEWRDVPLEAKAPGPEKPSPPRE